MWIIIGIAGYLAAFFISAFLAIRNAPMDTDLWSEQTILDDGDPAAKEWVLQRRRKREKKAKATLYANKQYIELDVGEEQFTDLQQPELQYALEEEPE